MNIQQVLLDEYKRHFDNLESIKTEYVNSHRAFANGTKFQYDGETCEVVGATFVFDPIIAEISILDVSEMIDFLPFAEFTPDKIIWYSIDIPKWRIPDKPEIKVTWSQAVLRKAVNQEAEWVRRQLRLCGYEIQPGGCSHGVLIKNDSTRTT
jgi:hypothetical protein